MAELGPLTSGVDTWVAQSNPTANHGGSRYLQAQSGDARILLAMPLAIPAGAVILEATLSFRARLNLAAQTWTAQALSEKWTPKSARWATPGVTGPTTSVAPGAVSAGSRFSLDMTDLVQSIADGQPNYGWRISTNHSASRQRLYGFNSGASSWLLTVAYSMPSLSPTGLAPEGVTSLAKWVAQVDEVDDLSAMRVQVDSDATGTPDFDSGWVTTTTPALDLATTTYAGLAAGASTWWRAATRTLDGGESDWSDWVQVTREAKPSITLLNPSGTTLLSPTSDITAELSAGATDETKWRITVTELVGQGATRYDSGLIPGAELDHALPLKWQGKLVFPTAGPYRLSVRAWDRDDRAPSIGDPTFVEVVRDITITDDDAIPVPTIEWVMQEGATPNVRVRITAPSEPERFYLYRTGGAAFAVDPDEARIAPGVFEFVDIDVPPGIPVDWRVAAQVGTAWSPLSEPTTTTVNVKGVWIASRFGVVSLAGPDTGNFKKTDKRTTFNLPYLPDEIDIITAVSGYSGGYEGYLSDVENDLIADAAILEQVRENPQYPVRLTWASVGVWVYLRSLSTDPHDPAEYPGNRMRRVTWEGMSETTDDDRDEIAAGLL